MNAEKGAAARETAAAARHPLAGRRAFNP